MPSKYSHDVVLASYSSRGIISLPNDKQLDYLKSRTPPPPVPTAQQSASAMRGRAPSAPPTHNHRATVRSTSARTSTSSDQHSSTVLVSNVVSHEPRNWRDYQTLGKPQGTSSASRLLTVIIDSDDEDLEHGSAKKQDLQSRVPTLSEARPPVIGPLSSPFESTREYSGPIQEPISYGEVESASHAPAATKRLEPKHISLLAAQKYARKADLQNAAQSNYQPSRGASLSLRTLPCDSTEPLLSFHELLNQSPNSSPQARVALSKPRSVIREETYGSGTVPETQQSGLPKTPVGMADSTSHRSSNRGHINFTELSGGDHAFRRSKDHLHHSAAATLAPAFSSPTEDHTQTVLDLTEEQPSEVIDMPTAERIGAVQDNSLDLSQQPDFDVSENHGDLRVPPVESVQPSPHFTLLYTKNKSVANTQHECNPPQNIIATEPDFSDFSNNEELDDPMNSALTDLYIRRHYYKAIDTNVANNASQLSISTSNSPQSKGRSDGRPPWSSNSGMPRATSIGSHARNGQEGATSKNSTALGTDPVLEKNPTARKLKESKQQVSKLKSEEEMRAKIPTPIPSLVSSPASAIVSRTLKTLPPLPMSYATPPRPTTYVSNIGMPSIVRSPWRREPSNPTKPPGFDRQKRSKTPQRQAAVSTHPRDTITPTRSPRDEGIRSPGTYYADPKDTGSEGDEASERWTLRITPVSQHPASSRSTPLNRFQAEFVNGSRSGSMTPRPERHRQHRSRRRSQTQSNHRATPAGQSLASAFEDTSISSSYLDHGLEPDPDFTVPNQDANEPPGHEAQSDPDAAPSPPDISRYPPDRRRPRARRISQHRLSSLTSLPRKSKTNRRSTLQPDGRMESIVRDLHVPERSAFEAGRGNADGMGAVSGPGRTTGIERLETLMLKAEEEAKANRGMKGVWGWLKRRIES